MTQTIEQEIASLKAMTVAELCVRYAEMFGEAARTRHKVWLFKRIIWRLQAKAEGDLSERARRRAAELANDADLRLYPPRASQTVPAGKHSTSEAQQPDSRLPAPGQNLSRLYKGRTVHVRVLSKGFEYDGVVYRSLSAVAKAITGSHTNGFLFFRLVGKGGSP
jgi:hypothetical protein